MNGQNVQIGPKLVKETKRDVGSPSVKVSSNVLSFLVLDKVGWKINGVDVITKYKCKGIEIALLR